MALRSFTTQREGGRVQVPVSRVTKAKALRPAQALKAQESALRERAWMRTDERADAARGVEGAWEGKLYLTHAMLTRAGEMAFYDQEDAA